MKRRFVLYNLSNTGAKTHFSIKSRQTSREVSAGTQKTQEAWRSFSNVTQIFPPGNLGTRATKRASEPFLMRSREVSGQASLEAPEIKLRYYAGSILAATSALRIDVISGFGKYECDVSWLRGSIHTSKVIGAILELLVGCTRTCWKIKENISQYFSGESALRFNYFYIIYFPLVCTVMCVV